MVFADFPRSAVRGGVHEVAVPGTSPLVREWTVVCDAPGASAADQELTSFLDAGAPPVVVTPGSANRHAGPFFAAATEALQRIGRRGLFLTGYPEQLPAELPDTILVRAYAPFSAVLPRSAAMIHHGGIGTMAQCLAAGVPQLIMPMAFDQPDNALRARKLGVARWHAPAEFSADNVASSLGELLGSGEVSRSVATCRSRLAGIDGIGMVCDRLERVAESGG